METKANYALIGAFVLMAFLAAIGFVAWLSNSQFDQQFEEFDIAFTGPVRGLSQGAEVRYNGLRVGEVTRLYLDPDNSDVVIARTQIDANTPIRTNSSAKLEPQGLTGLSYIQITSAGNEFPMFRDVEGPNLINGEKSDFETIIQGGGTVLEKADLALRGVNNLLNPQAVNDFQDILANINVITSKLSEAELDSAAISDMLGAITRAAGDLSSTLETYDEVARDVQEVVKTDLSTITERLDETMDRVDAVLVSADGAVGNGDLLITDAREAINRLSNSGLTDLEETTDSLRQLVSTLNRIALQLERSPTQFIVGAERQIVEIPQ